MKDGLNALYERRSVRKYKSEQISDGELEQILKAGLCAPSAMNRQPAIIIAVQDKDTREKRCLESGECREITSAAATASPAIPRKRRRQSR